MAHISPEVIESVKSKELTILKQREELYREGRPFPSLNNKIVILVDDGIATGATMRAAIAAIKKLLPEKLVIVTPVAPLETVNYLQQEVENVILFRNARSVLCYWSLV